MRRSPRLPATAFALSLGAVLALSSCSAPGSAPDTQRYYDPEGRFSLTIPSGRQIEQMIPNEVILGGARFDPPDTTSAVGTRFGNLGDLGGNGEDKVGYLVITVDPAMISTTGAPPTPEELREGFVSTITGNETVANAEMTLGDEATDVVVIDAEQDGAPFSAAITTAVTQDAGYVLMAIFERDGWEDSKAGFNRLLRSFDTDAPAGLSAVVPEGENEPSPIPSTATG